jgi:hypothetical protein
MMIVVLEDRLMSVGPAILKGWAVGNLQHSPQRRAGRNSSNSRNVAPANSPGLRYRASIARPKSGAFRAGHAGSIPVTRSTPPGHLVRRASCGQTFHDIPLGDDEDEHHGQDRENNSKREHRAVPWQQDESDL